MKVHFATRSFTPNCKEHSCVNLEKMNVFISGLESKGVTSLSDHLSDIIHDRLSVPGTNILEYLSTTYDLAQAEKDKTMNKNKHGVHSFISFLQKILQNTAFSYIQLPEKMYENEFTKSNLAGIDFSAYKLFTFLENTENYTFIKKSLEGNMQGESEFVFEFSEAVVTLIESRLNDLTIVDDRCCVYVRILIKLIEFGLIQPNEIKKNLILEVWCPIGIENNNLIGAIFGVDSLPKKNNLVLAYGLMPVDKIRDFIRCNTVKESNAASETLKRKNENYVMACSDFLKLLLKHHQAPSLLFLRKIVALNYVKSKFEMKTLISPVFNQFTDSFCVNFLDFLLELSSPFTILDDPKQQKILKNHLRMDQEFKNLLTTPILRSENRSFEPSEIPGTISHFFYCTLFMLKFGWTSLNKKLKFFTNLQSEQTLKQQTFFSQYTSLIMDSYSVVLLNEKRNGKIFNFYLVFCDLLQTWNGFSGTLPLKSPDICLSYIPENILKDFAGFLCWLLLYNSTGLFSKSASSPVGRFLTFATVLISSPDLFPNLKVVNKFVKALNLFFKKTILSSYSDIFKANEIAKKYLLVSVLKMYVRLEKYQFYGVMSSKLLFRKNACKLLKNLFTNEYFFEQVVQLQNKKCFMKFMNFLFDEITLSFESGINNIYKYKEFFEKSKIDQTVAEQLENSRVSCRIYWRLLNTNFSVLVKLTDQQIESLSTDMFGKRIAAFLNQFLFTLNGPDYTKIKIEDPKSLCFKPQKILESLIKVYTNLSKFPSFYQYIINDSRYFSISLFQKTRSTIKHRVPMDIDNLFNQFVDKLYVISNQMVMNYDDAPEEFLCEITKELLKNPVQLPSGVVVDKSNIERHLLTSNYDPFTKLELKIEDIKEMPELKSRIAQWVANKT